MYFVKKTKAHASVPENLLHGHIVYAKGFSRFDVCNGLLQGEAVGVERYQVIAGVSGLVNLCHDAHCVHRTERLVPVM